MRTKIRLLCILLSCSAGCFAQSPVLAPNQPVINLNPSFAGSNGGIRNQALYQHDSCMNSSFVMLADNFDAYIKQLNAGIALSYQAETGCSGTYRTFQVNFTYAQHLVIQKLKLIPSMQVGYYQNSLDPSKLTFGSMISPGLIYQGGNPLSNKIAADISAGLLAIYKNWYAGISAYHINHPDVTLTETSRLPVRFTANVSYNLHFSDKTLYNFSASCSRQDGFNLAKFNANAIFYKHLIAGLGFMVNNIRPIAFIYASGIYYKNTQMLSLGYRGNFISLTAACIAGYNTTGHYLARGFNLCLSYNLRNKEQRRQLTNLEAQ